MYIAYPWRGWRVVGVWVLLVVMFLGYAQEASDPFADMEQLLAEGRYALATQVEGPALVSRFANDPYAHYLYAQALYLVGDVEAAQGALAEALANMDTTDAAALPLVTLQGKLAAAQGELTRAQTLLRDVFERQPDYASASNWGQVAWQAANYDVALEAFRAAQDYAATTEETASALLNYARVLRLSDQPEEAVRVLENLLDILDAQVITELPPPAYAQAFLLLGTIYQDQGDIAKARANYEAARLADPNAVAATVALEQLPAPP
jgi:tetratricopeptide (TPR) repeat protein